MEEDYEEPTNRRRKAALVAIVLIIMIGIPSAAYALLQTQVTIPGSGSTPTGTEPTPAPTATPTASLSVSPSTIDWGHPLNVTYDPNIVRTVTVTNTGSVPLQLSMVARWGYSATDQGVSTGTITWNKEGTILQPSQNVEATLYMDGFFFVKKLTPGTAFYTNVTISGVQT